MAKIIVAGLINLETTLRVERFPVTYEPVRYPFFGVQSRVSGVGYNVAKALHTLGDEVRLLSLIGQDDVGKVVNSAIQAVGFSGKDVLQRLDETPQSVILYDREGRRAIQVDLKDIQEQHFPLEEARALLRQADAAVLCNINFARPLLAAAQELNVPIITDVHALSNLEDAYNRDFMAAADVLFLSDEHLPFSPETCIRCLQNLYRPQVIVVGLGARGVLYTAKQMVTPRHIPSISPRPVVNTIGAGDALLSAFSHFYVQGRPVEEAIRYAVVFAGYKVSFNGAAEGFLNENELSEVFEGLSG